MLRFVRLCAFPVQYSCKSFTNEYSGDGNFFKTIQVNNIAVKLSQLTAS